MEKTLIYIANIRLPTERTHGIQVVKMCEAFADTGIKVTLLVPKRRKRIKEDVFSYYGIKKNFEIKYIFAPNPIHYFGEIGFLAGEVIFTLSIFFKLIVLKNEIIFSRSVFPAWLASFLGKKVFFEMHDLPLRFHFVWKSFLSSMTGIVSTNHWKAEKLKSEFLIPEGKILVYPNGFDPKLFDIKESKEELRKNLGLPDDKPIAMYTGSLYVWKGADVLLEAARKSQTPNSNFKNDVLFVFVGGTEEAVANFKIKARGLKNVLIVGQRPYTEIPRWLKAANVLVLPNSAKTEESQYATSPIKLFEYMASGVPIVVSDLPSIREIVSEHEAYFVKSDVHDKLVGVIRDVLHDRDTPALRAQNALAKSKMYSWQTRAKKIAIWFK